MKSQDPFSAFDPTKLFGSSMDAFKGFQLPGFDMNALAEITRRDFAALSEAQQAALAGMKMAPEDIQRQLTDSYTRLGELMQRLTANPAGGSADFGAVVQESMAKAFGDLRELAESAQASQVKAWGLLLKRAQDRVQELNALMAKRG